MDLLLLISSNPKITANAKIENYIYIILKLYNYITNDLKVGKSAR